MIPLWAKLAGWGVLLLGGAYLGWTIESWREGAAKARILARDVEIAQAQIDALKLDAIELEGARNEAEKTLTTREAANAKTIADLQKQISTAVERRPDCDYSEPARLLLERAWAGSENTLSASAAPPH